MLAGCGRLKPHVPDDFQGDVPIVVQNQFVGKICTFGLRLDPNAGAKNWLGLASIAAGTSLTFKVRPGSYRVVVGGCNDEYPFMVDNQTAAIRGPTVLRIGRAGGKRTPGYALIAVRTPAVGADEPAGDTGDSGEAPESCLQAGQVTKSERDCCSNDTAWPAGSSFASAMQNGTLTCK
ncbi:MAG: hypothetical protein JWO36_4644 [Myxococcales bacterium]|nr:hypothetical protein [Myxococcales bacterium]